MATEVTVTGDTAEEELRSLYQWLASDEEARGTARLSQAPAVPGRLGSVGGVLSLALTPGVAGAVAGAVVAWLRQRTADVTLEFKRPDGASSKITARRLQGLGAPELRFIAIELMNSLDIGAAERSQEDPARDPGAER